MTEKEDLSRTGGHGTVKKVEDERKAKLAVQPPAKVEVTEEVMGDKKKEEPQGSSSTDSKLDDMFGKHRK